MYENFYRLHNDPFRLLPDPAICFPHSSCAKAWAYLRYAVDRGEGVVVITGAPGSGKTTLAERLLKELNPSNTISARLVAQDMSATDLLRKVGYAFGLAVERLDHAMLMHRLEQFFIELERSHRRAVVVIDEAQALPYPALEAMRLLTDLQSNSKSVVQLFLLGHEELESTMSAPRLMQFQQRVIASCRLQPMNLSETKAYLEYRLARANWQGTPAINGRAVLAIHKHSGGLPRQVNKICSRLFLYGSAEEKSAFTEQDVQAVVEDFREESLEPIGEVRLNPESAWVEEADAVGELALVPLPPSDVAASTAGTCDISPMGLDAAPAAINRTTTTPAPARVARDNHRPAVRSTSVEPKTASLTRALRKLQKTSAHKARAKTTTAALTAGLREVQKSVVQKILVGTRHNTQAKSKRNGFLRASRFGLTRLKPRGMARRALFATAASLVVVPIAAALLLTKPTSEPGAQRLEQSGSVVSASPGLPYASTLEEVGDSEITAALEPQPLTNRTPYYHLAASGPADDLVAGIANEARARLDQGLATLGGIHNREVAAGTADAASPAAKEVVDGDADSASGTETVAVIDQQEINLADADPSVVLPSPAAGGTSTSMPAGDPTLLSTGVDIAALAESATDLDTQDKPPTPAPYDAMVTESASSGSTDPIVSTMTSTGTGAIPAFLPQADADVEVETHDATADAANVTARPPRASSAPIVRTVSSIESAAMSLRPVADADGEVDNPQPAIDRASATELPAPGTAEPIVLAVSSTDTGAIPEPQPTPFEVTQAQRDAEEIERLLGLADQSLARNRLLFPTTDSAYGHFNQVLLLDAQNDAALTGLTRIVERYGELAEKAFAGRKFDSAKLFVGRALRVAPENAEMVALGQRIEATIAEELEQAELQRQAEAARLAAEAAALARLEEPVEPPKTSRSFNELIWFN